MRHEEEKIGWYVKFAIEQMFDEENEKSSGLRIICQQDSITRKEVEENKDE